MPLNKAAFKTVLSVWLMAGLGLTPAVEGQTIREEPDLVNFSGYIKNLGISRTNQDFEKPLYDNLLHNRLELSVNPNKHWDITIEERNRLRYGEQVELYHNFGLDYGNLMDAQNGLVNLSKTWYDRDDAVLHSEIDRFYVAYDSGDWRFTVGRQRINWGKNRIWNPNDLFNNYSFFDFDYRKRPGVDALRIEYFRNFNSSIELAFNPAEDFEKSIGAIYYGFHKVSYDFQVLGGYFKESLVSGLGWSGYIGGAAFKGEVNYYQPAFNDNQDGGYLLASVSTGYTFSNALSLHLEGIYNGNNNRVSFNQLVNTSGLQANNLTMFKYGVYSELKYNIHPLVTANLGNIYYPNQSLNLVAPSISYSLASNWDIFAMAQLFTGEVQNLTPETAGSFGSTASRMNLMTLRVQWSF